MSFHLPPLVREYGGRKRHLALSSAGELTHPNTSDLTPPPSSVTHFFLPHTLTPLTHPHTRTHTYPHPHARLGHAACRWETGSCAHRTASHHEKPTFDIPWTLAGLDSMMMVMIMMMMICCSLGSNESPVSNLSLVV
jgi:hypothetical protein